MSPRAQLVVTVARWLIEYWHTENFWFSSTDIKIFESRKLYLANVVEIAKFNSNEMSVNTINRTVNSDKFSRSCDDLYVVVIFWVQRVFISFSDIFMIFLMRQCRITGARCYNNNN